MTRLNVALIGCGRIGERHATLLGAGEIEGARLACVCDPAPGRARDFAERFGVPGYENADDLFAPPGGAIDAVIVATPSGAHAELAIAAARAGLHVVVEKPMALTMDDAAAMIQAAADAGVKLFVVQQNRYNRPIVRLRREFESGRFGKLVMGTVRVRWKRTQDYYDQDDWRGTWAMDGGVFANQASHHIDLLEWFLGTPISVFAKSRTALVDIETEDTGVALIEFRNGALGVVEATTATRPDDLEASLSILGERGAVEIGGFAANEIKTWRFEDAARDDDTVIDDHRTNPPNVYGYGHKVYLSRVADSILNGAEPPVDGLEGLKSLELISAIYESISTGREIALRFQAVESRLGRG